RPLSAADRSFTSTSFEPTDLLPAGHQYSGVFSAHQDLWPHWEASTDVLYTHSGEEFDAAGSKVDQHLSSRNSELGANATLGYPPTAAWRIEATGAFSEEATDFAQLYVPQQNAACGTGPCDIHQN